MADFAFQGASALALDGKGRINVPARHRDALQVLSEGRLTITKHPNDCLMVFPRPAWEDFRDRLMNLPLSADGWRRIFLGNAMDVDIDASGRLLIPPELRVAAGFTADTKEVTLLGLGRRLELWDKARLAVHEAEVKASAMPAALQEFVL